MDDVKIVAEYSDGCFCERPQLQPVIGAYRPFFQFAALAKQCAEINGIIWGGLNKRGTGRSAWGILPVSCAHRQQQQIRFDWHLNY